MHDVEDHLELRPDFKTGLILVTVMVVAAVSIIAAILAGDAPTVFAPIVGALFAVMITLLTGTFLGSRITLTPHEIIVRWLFIRQRRSRPQISAVVRATLIAPRGSPGDSLFLLDAHGNLLIRLSAGLYKREDFDRLIRALGVPCSGPDHPVRVQEFAEIHPGLVSWAERHPYRLAFAVFGAVSAAVVALVLVLISTAS
jgi:hypothetical protein